MFKENICSKEKLLEIQQITSSAPFRAFNQNELENYLSEQRNLENFGPIEFKATPCSIYDYILCQEKDSQSESIGNI